MSSKFDIGHMPYYS